MIFPIYKTLDKNQQAKNILFRIFSVLSIPLVLSLELYGISFKNDIWHIILNLFVFICLAIRIWICIDLNNIYNKFNSNKNTDENKWMTQSKMFLFIAGCPMITLLKGIKLGAVWIATGKT